MKKSVVLTWLLWGSTIGSMMGNSFETAEDLKGVSGHVSISEEQYRFGTHALKWEARDGESIRIAMDGRKNRRREVSFHIYAMKPDPDTVLELQIGDPPRKGEYRVRIPLRFPYWQLVRVSPWEDLERIPVADARDEMVITYRGREPQTLYLDALQFVSSWQRVPNLLVPGANPKRPAMHGKTPGKKLLSAVLPQVEKWRQAPPPTPEEAQALQELRRRARSWLTDFGPDQDPRLKAARAAGILEEAEEAWRRYQALAIHTDDGRNFRFQSAPEPRDGYDMSWRDLATKTLLPLLYAVNVDMPGNRFYRNPEAIAAVVQLAGLMRYQGFAFGADHNWHVIFALRGMGQTLFLMQDTLREAGLDRLNISLDTLRPDRFAAMTRLGTLRDVLDGIQAAEAAGFEDLKLDTVLIGGFNDDEIGDFVDLSRDRPWELRFIELMPMGPCAGWDRSCFLPCDTVLDRVPELEAIEAQGVARRYRLPGARGTVGLISPVSHDFCADCRRIRVTADGKLKGCLHSREEIPLRGLHGEALTDAVRQGILHKPERHHLAERASDTPRNMNQIGG